MNKKFENPAAEAAERVRESAQQIWLAGLGAFAKAQQEGGKVFEALVQDGVNLQRKTQAVAQERMAEATEKITEMAGGLSAKAGQQWGRLEGIFEERVARALEGLGVPSADQLQALEQRVKSLELLLLASRSGPTKPRSAARSVKPAKTERKAVAKKSSPPAEKSVRRRSTGQR